MDAQNEQLREQRYVVTFCCCQGKSRLEKLNSLCTTYGDVVSYGVSLV